MRELHDIIIVGSGPAGASCAGRASELGLDVLVLERTPFPRSKPCAAGLTESALRFLGADADPLAHDTATRLRVEAGAVSLVWIAEHPLVRTTTRRELDAHLAKRAKEAGARIEFGMTVKDIMLGGDAVSVRAGGQSFRGRFLVGADGPRSEVARVCGCREQRLSGAAYVRAFPASASELEGFKGTVFFHPAAIRRGYGWIFPKRDHLNVGVYSQRPLEKGLLVELTRYLRELGIDSWDKQGPYAAPVPSAARSGDLARGRVLLAGDAASLADPITGEGISHAMASGRLAAESIHDALAERAAGDDAGRIYSERVRSSVVPALSRLRRLGNALYSLGPRGLETAIACPPARFVVRRLGWWERTSQGGGRLLVEKRQGYRHQ